LASQLGFVTNGVSLSANDLQSQKLPCILYWENRHFVVLHKVKKNVFTVSDPGPGISISYSKEEFEKKWLTESATMGYALILEPTEKLKALRTEEQKKKLNFLLLKYFIPFKAYYLLILLGMGIGLSLSFITPFLTKAVVDIGLRDKSITFINLILLAQFMTALSTISLSLVRNWIFLYMGWKMNFSAITDFLTKVLKMPISYFDSSQVGDILQRINDHYALKTFVSSSTFNIAFSFVNVIVFGGILAYYNLLIFLIFVVSSVLYVFWVTRFMKQRKEFDYKVFDKNALNQNKLLQIFSGIKDIKLHNFEQESKQEWVKIQAELFTVNERQMIINQYQQVGSFFIDIIKTLLISYFTAKLVIQGEMTLGMMLSVQYILGQLNLPVAQFIGFNNALQDAKISIERIGEVYDRNDEDESENTRNNFINAEDIIFNNLSYTYPQTGKPVLKNIN
ncbi:peptidase domain-containing ABC transporter, partial [bacterium]